MSTPLSSFKENRRQKQEARFIAFFVLLHSLIIYFQGTNDTTAYLCMNTALDFYEVTCGGREAIAAYVTRLLDFAERLFCESFGVKPMPVAPELRAPYMRIVGKQSHFALFSKSLAPTFRIGLGCT